MLKIAPDTRVGKIRFLIILAILCLVLIDLVAIPCYWTQKYRPREGDFIFQSLVKSELVRLIEGGMSRTLN